MSGRFVRAHVRAVVGNACVPFATEPRGERVVSLEDAGDHPPLTGPRHSNAWRATLAPIPDCLRNP